MSNPFIRQALDLIDRHPSERFTAKEIAGHVHFNASYFSVLFKNEVGATFSEYVAGKRMQRAKELLRKTDFKVYEIAEKTGFRSASYFVKTFQELEGLTPGRYRQLYR